MRFPNERDFFLEAVPSVRGRTGVNGTHNDVTLQDFRRHNLRELLMDFSLPGLCIVLGAGASYGVIPMSPAEMAQLARDLLEANGNRSVLPARSQEQLQHPAVVFITNLLRHADRGAWDRILSELLTPGYATFVLNEMFTPRAAVPQALVRIYDVLESERGVIVSYNYDRITDAQNRFTVIAPHGQRSDLLTNPKTRATAKEMALELHLPIPMDIWLPLPQADVVQERDGYQRTLTAWRRAASIVFIGYGFGGGADAFSFQDFGRNVSPLARIHVLGPRPDNNDLCRQVGHAITGRGPGFRVYGQPFRWRALAEAMLETLDALRVGHVRHLLGKETIVSELHDRL
jgi:hypothetical protein